MRTKAWIKQTATSKSNKIKSDGSETQKGNNLAKTNSTCPAVKLAINRRAKVKGRKSWLNVSTKTIKFHKAKGVDKGKQCAALSVGCWVQEYSISAPQHVNLKKKLPHKWAVKVKEKGTKPITFQPKAEEKIAQKTQPLLPTPGKALNTAWTKPFKATDLRLGHIGTVQGHNNKITNKIKRNLNKPSIKNPWNNGKIINPTELIPKH